MRNTAANFLQRVKILKIYIKEGEIVLDSYNPGDQKRYQIEILDEKGQLIRTLPHESHISGPEFSSYLRGLMDGLAYYETHLLKDKP